MMNGSYSGLKIALDFVGCKLNQAEVEHLARQFVEAGYKLVSPHEPFDVYVLNTCTVTHIADRKSRHLLRMAHRRNPKARLIVTGCYSQRARDELSRIEGVELIIDNDRKSNLLEIMEESGCKIGNGSISQDTKSRSLRTRSFVKVQDGCNNFCAYCIVPLVRGREKSVRTDEIIAKVKERTVEGYKEVVLTGTEIGRYNYNGVDFVGLIKRVLSETDIVRLRLSSLQPQEITDDLVELWRDRRLCRHFHLSLQSGSDTALKRMNRRYNIEEYDKAVSLIKSSIPEIAITTDIIVGFPGETEEEFQESYNFCNLVGFSRIHVFSYSLREGTTAAGMRGQIGSGTKKLRSEKILALAEESASNFRNNFLGKIMNVLWEQETEGKWSGYTDNYIKIYWRSDNNLTNELTQVKLVELYEDGIWGEGV